MKPNPSPQSAQRETAAPLQQQQPLSRQRLLLSGSLLISFILVVTSNFRLLLQSHSESTLPDLQLLVEAVLLNATLKLSNQERILASNATGSNEDSKITTAAAYDDFPKEPVPRPALDSIVQDWNVTGDASWLLNVAVIGMPKCGTSSLMFQLDLHPEVKMFPHERCELTGNQQVPLIRDLYNEFPAGDYVRGIKCPQDLESSMLSLRNYRKYFPKTDFIVGVRHPILWFESFYNFRVHNAFKMPPIENLIGACFRGMFGVCTHRANFHFYLNNLAKVSDPEAIRYIPRRMRRNIDYVNSSARVFFYEVSQLSDTNPERMDQFLVDLQRFLRLRVPIQSMMKFKPGKNHTDERLRKLNEKKVDICEDKYATLRSELLGIAVNASRWIREYFIHAPDVVVSGKDYLGKELLLSWETDPCFERNSTAVFR